MTKHIAHPSKMRRLPAAIREQVNRMLEAGATIDEVVAALDAMGAKVTRTGVGKYRREWAEIGKDMREMKQAAEAALALLEKNGRQAGDARIANALIEHGLVKALFALHQAEGDMKLQDILKLIERASSASINLARTEKARVETEREQRKLADGEATTAHAPDGTVIRVEVVRPKSIDVTPATPSVSGASREVAS